jgi:hypothetical protein
MPRSLFWYANMTNQPTATYAKHTKAWRLIMRSMVFMKCEEKRESTGERVSILNFERFYCQEILVYYWLSVFDPPIYGGHLFLFFFLENIQLERTIPQTIVVVMITAGKSRG